MVIFSNTSPGSYFAAIGWTFRTGKPRSTNYNFRANMNSQHPKSPYEYEQQKLLEEEEMWRQMADKQYFRLQLTQSVLIILLFVAFWSWLIFMPIIS
jgi:hypothetical protein